MASEQGHKEWNGRNQGFSLRSLLKLALIILAFGVARGAPARQKEPPPQPPAPSPSDLPLASRKAAPITILTAVIAVSTLAGAWAVVSALTGTGPQPPTAVSARPT